jgi:nickel-dependent lactate racemase
MGHRLTLPFEGGFEASLPDGWRVAPPLEPDVWPAAPDPEAALLEALANPIGRTPPAEGALRGKRIVLAVEDVSRPTPVHRFFPALVARLERCGARREDLRVLFGLGVHRGMTEAEASAKLGDLGGIAWENHDCRDDARHVDLGPTSRGTPVLLNRRLAEADVVFCIGAVEPHLLLGFGGGLKMICPGLAHERMIARNHMQGVSAERFNYVGALESPMRLDLEEAAGKLGADLWAVNALLAPGPAIARFVCGDPVAAQREGARAAAAAHGRRVDGPVDVAIVCSDPMNADLRQGMKSIGNVEPAVRDGGLIVAFLECRNGVGDVQVPPRSLPNGVLRLLLRALGPSRILGFVDRVKRGAGTEERFLSHFSLQVVRRVRILVHSRRLPPDVGRRMGLFRQFADPAAMLAEAARLAPRHARAIVSPRGGVAYPVVGGG